MPSSNAALRRFPSYSELVASRREAEQMEEVLRAFGDTPPTKEELEHDREIIARMWKREVRHEWD